jgi:hypothetical protein
MFDGTNWVPDMWGGGMNSHYALPADSPLLAPLQHTVNLPAGLPPVPEEGLEVAGWGALHLVKGGLYYYAKDGAEGWSGPIKSLQATDGDHDMFFLRRPSPPKPARVPFDCVEDFGSSSRSGCMSPMEPQQFARGSTHQKATSAFTMG